MASNLGDDADMLYLKFFLYERFHNLRRKAEVTLIDFICEFENKYFELEEHMQVPDLQRAFMLLSSSMLSEDKIHLVMLQVSSDINYDSMKAAILNVTSDEIKDEYDPMSDEVQMQLEREDEEKNGDEDTTDTDRDCKRPRYSVSTETEPMRSKTLQRHKESGNLDDKKITCFYCDSDYRWHWKCNCNYEYGSDRNSTRDVIFNRKMKFRRLRDHSNINFML